MRFGDRGAARANAELGEDRRDVVIDRLGRDEQARADVVVGQAEREGGEDFLFARGQIERMVAAGGARSARDAANTEPG